jgi:hypothetical protein
MLTKTDLLKDPLQSGRQHSLRIVLAAWPQMKSKPVTEGGNVIESFLQVKGESRVALAKLKDAGKTCDVFIEDYSPEIDSESEFPVYYLPWAANTICRMTLKPSKNQKIDKAPQIFFTANLNGCQVIVEGPADRPTVYHCNAQQFLGDPGSDVSMSDKDARQQILLKTMIMELGYKKMSEQFDKKKKGLVTHVNPKGIGQQDYQVLVGRPSADADEKRVLKEIMAEKGLKNFTENSGIINFEQSRGTVFGVCPNGFLWTFYYQKALCLSTYSKDDSSGKTSLKFLYEQWHVLECNEFWPHGSGHLTI